MDQKPINPLVKHFRRPAIHYRLPSDGKYWPDNTLDLPVTGEIPVYPMTTADEITLKTPDALMNGSGVVSVIESCCPNIKDAWKMPSIDVDAVLIAVRIASYGKGMSVKSTCPKCNKEHLHEVDLTQIISQVVAPNYNNLVEYDGLKIKLKPQDYYSINQTNMASFEERRIMDTLSDEKLDDDVKNARLAQSMKNLLASNTGLMVGSTEYIETEDGVRVTETDFIEEFYKNAENKLTKLIEAKLSELAKEGALPPSSLGCDDCKENYDVPIAFDYASFFA
jgi:hypothetical protein